MKKLNLNQFADNLIKETTKNWIEQTQKAAKVAESKTPVGKGPGAGKLKRSLRVKRAVTTSTGIESGYIFDVDYAIYVEAGHPTQAGFAEAGKEMFASSIMNELKDSISTVWRKV